MSNELNQAAERLPRIEAMIAQLKAAGWTEVRATLWKCPYGWHYRGPHHAWKVMQKMKATKQ